MTFENMYFKQLPDESGLMSGLNLPEPGEHRFINCEFHPRLWEALEQLYKDCTFTNCNYPR